MSEKQVFVVRGEYGEIIYGVFSTKERAEEEVKSHSEACMVEEFILDKYY